MRISPFQTMLSNEIFIPIFRLVFGKVITNIPTNIVTELLSNTVLRRSVNGLDL